MTNTLVYRRKYKMTEHKHAEILRAIADGREVEWFDGNSNVWVLSQQKINPISFPHFEWRIKPEKKVLRYRVARMKDFIGEQWLHFEYVLPAGAPISDRNYLIMKDNAFVEWIHDWQEVEVE